MKEKMSWPEAAVAVAAILAIAAIIIVVIR